MTAHDEQRRYNRHMLIILAISMAIAAVVSSIR